MKRTLVQVTARPYMLSEGLEEIRSARHLFLQTRLHPAAEWLLQEGIEASDMDDLYAEAEDFDSLNMNIARRIADCNADCVYAYTGSIARSQIPAIRSAVEEKGDVLRILPALSGAEIAFPGCAADRCLSAAEWDGTGSASETLCFTEMDSQLAAGELKRQLSELFPDDWKIRIADYSREGQGYCSREILLYELDRQEYYDAATSVLVPACPFFDRTRYDAEDLLEILKRLRRPDGCPWDRVQTHASLKDSLLEETYEVMDAIDRESDEDLCEELGDLWMNILFHSIIAEEQSSFTTRDVTTEIVRKLIYRHPHVFGKSDASTPEEVLVKWEELKKQEKHQTTQTDALQSVPKAFPALLRARKVQKRAADVGFEWNNPGEAADKVAEELSEVREEASGSGHVYEECGDLLLAAANLARMLGVNPELALQDATDKFIRRFERMEQLGRLHGEELKSLRRDELLRYWENAKELR